ncbi:bile acid:sodium symporter family protein [Leptospira langatensis]|uniref:Bile acid:sodium symporter family protein n=1 Tax=Leptospira langatensis TaxID=2484983 RepID=A0A5F1ZSL8_9LEPT|nr:bile acid:sodium symporter family protein [Leptospira langatensis]TGK02708.1 bile acid:sodium symporter family protein [Leptospira langatensis]TGL40089.1 bile acid:sodium symporter family protein [Leptospira langatensis]
MQFGVVEKALLPTLLAIVMLGMGFGLAISDFRRIFTTPLQTLVGTLGHFVIMPLAAYVVVLLLGLEYELALGVILVGSCPSGTTSNLINYLAKGDVALAVVITSLSTLLCPILTPIIVTFFGSLLDSSGGKVMEISFLEMLKTVIVIIVVPITIGMSVKHRFPNFAKQIEKPYKIFSILFLVFVVVFVTYKNREEFWNMVALVGFAVILHNTFGFVVGYLVPKLLRLGERQSRTISIEVAIQNTTLGMTLAIQFFGPKVALPSAIFSIWMYITGLIMALVWSRVLPLREEKTA